MLKFRLYWAGKSHHSKFTVSGEVDIYRFETTTRSSFTLKGNGTKETPYLITLLKHSKLNASSIDIYDSDSYIHLIASKYHTVNINKCPHVSISNSKLTYLTITYCKTVKVKDLIIKRKASFWYCNKLSIAMSKIRRLSTFYTDIVSISNCHVNILEKYQNEISPQISNSQINKVKVKKVYI